MASYLISFYPLCCTAAGRQAVAPNLPPYIDGSCRREPDFQNEFPAITGLCRPGFSTKLKKGDFIIYITNKAGIRENKFIAVLQVIHCAPNHEDAAHWYRNESKKIPNNLMVNETHPFPLNRTHQIMGWNAWAGRIHTLQEWNACYIQRAQDRQEVAICKIWKRHLYLNNPASLTDRDKIKIFGRVPGTHNYVGLTDTEWGQFQTWLDNNHL